ncbi:immunoglobulin-like and fibronectin type III domain-containing protein 1 [Triplophysa dalaica]|uniref:immunoglobulin-like and fibronectin type III domain-containing protein 1 n=1 Tax=Triplophysa dalaica TaxID=1582913 RepID=UPI0024E03EAA|nr:immunoglobulin-like and fibronectin type III domain-containing protein 1 [Triplophysa dalaica]
MITQYVEELPPEKTTPDFTRKPIALTIQEGKLAIFKAVVNGDPAPEVTWGRNKGELSDSGKYKTRFDERNQEYILEMPNVSSEQADTYKCIAINSFGKAVCTATLNVIEVGFKKRAPAPKNDPEDFRKMLKKTVVTRKQKQWKEGEIDPRFWEVLLSANKIDYEHICLEYGVTDFRWMLKILNQMKMERDAEQSKYVEKIHRMKQIEVKTDGTAKFELDMKLKDPSSKISLFKDGKMLDYGVGNDDSKKHNMQKLDETFLFSIKDLGPEDAGLYQVDVEEANVFSTALSLPDVEFDSTLKDTTVVQGQDAMFMCALSAPVPKITWCANDVSFEHGDKYDVTVSENKQVHKLTVKNCKPEDKGVYSAIVGLKSSHGTLVVDDPGVHFLSGLSNTKANVGESAELSCKLSSEDSAGMWYKDGKKLESKDGITVVKDGPHHKLIISICQDKDSGTYKFEAEGRKTQATLTIEDPARIDAEALGKFSQPVIVKAGENASFKVQFSGKDPIKIQWFQEDEELLEGHGVKIERSSTHSRLRLAKCQRRDTGEIKIKIRNEFDSVAATSQLIVLAFPRPPGPPKIVSAYKDCINLKWLAPSNTGGSITGYNVEKRKKGSNFWSQVNPKDEPIRDKKFLVKNIIEGSEYEFRVTAMNTCGPGEPSVPSECVFARDPKKPPGKVKDIKLTASSYTTLSLSWAKPTVVTGVEDEAKEYFLEIRPTDQLEWSRCHTNAVIQTSFTVMGLKSMASYWVRVTATNEGGEGLPQALDNYITAMPPPVKPKFTDSKMKNFMVVIAGNTVRVSVSFEACPIPDITWLKDGFPVAKHVTIIDLEKVSQLFIHTSELSDTGIYTVTVKNVVGQDTFTIEIRVTDDPRPPGPVELEQNVQGTVTVTWAPSPDEKRDDRLHYTVMKRDSIKQTWRTVVDHLFNNKFTVVNILPGREYNFRVFAKNDISISEPSVSPVWGTTKKREKFTCDLPESKTLDFQAAPKFIVPLKRHVAPPGYECYMSCAVIGNPTPHVTWYRNNVSLNTNPNYYITNVCGVCSMLILMVGPKDMGEYMVVADSPLGRAECSTTLTIRE